MILGKISLPLFLWVFVAACFGAMEFKEADITTVKNIVERNEGAGAMPAKVNDKVTEKSVVSTAAASMAELTFADSSITRMGSNTQFSFKSAKLNLTRSTNLLAYWNKSAATPTPILYQVCYFATFAGCRYRSC